MGNEGGHETITTVTVAADNNGGGTVGSGAHQPPS